MFKRIRFLVAWFVVAVATPSFLVGQTQNPKATDQGLPAITAEKPMSFWMKSKLNLSKSSLESLTKGDFEKLEKDAEQMRLIGKLEGFVRRTNPTYKSHLHAFDLANQELARQAKRRNAEGAALAFNQLTSSCVACHVMLREGIE
jgi:hypothetical protein